MGQATIAGKHFLIDAQSLDFTWGDQIDRAYFTIATVPLIKKILEEDKKSGKDKNHYAIVVNPRTAFYLWEMSFLTREHFLLAREDDEKAVELELKIRFLSESGDTIFLPWYIRLIFWVISILSVEKYIDRDKVIDDFLDTKSMESVSGTITMIFCLNSGDEEQRLIISPWMTEGCVTVDKNGYIL